MSESPASRVANVALLRFADARLIDALLRKGGAITALGGPKRLEVAYSESAIRVAVRHTFCDTFESASRSEALLDVLHESYGVVEAGLSRGKDEGDPTSSDSLKDGL